MKISDNAKKAIMIGSMCSFSYLAVYIARNLLSAVTPQMLEGGAFTEEFIGNISSVYFFVYAIGQLINGAIGDKIKARYMIGFGLLLAGLCNLFFPFVAHLPWAVTVVYGATGFFLAMIYGPMTKVVAENTEPIYATRCSLGYTFASFIGTPAAGMLAAFLAWQSVFFVGSSVLILMGCVCFAVFLAYEKKGFIRYGRYTALKKEGGVKILIKNRIVKFALISVLTGVVRTSVVFWLPVYLSQALGFSSAEASAIFSASTLVISATAFIAIFIYEKLGYNMDKTLLLMFALSTIFFGGVFFVKFPWVNLVLMVLAIMSANGAACMLWSRYCPGLRDTGMVSVATGFLDFVSYMAAAFANAVFGNAVTDLGWDNLILIWLALMVVGVVVSLPYGRIFRKKTANA